MPIGCENGRVLLVSRTRDHLGLLRLFDIATNKTITTLEVREHATLLLQDEWFFDGQSAIAVNNEHKLVTVGQSKMLISTGKLSAFDLARGKPINSIDLSSEHPSEGRIAGFDASLGWLFYGVRNKLYVINIGSMKVVKALDVPVSAQFVLSQSPREN